MKCKTCTNSIENGYRAGFDVATGKCWWCLFKVVSREDCDYARELAKRLS